MCNNVVPNKQRYRQSFANEIQETKKWSGQTKHILLPITTTGIQQQNIGKNGQMGSRLQELHIALQYKVSSH